MNRQHRLMPCLALCAVLAVTACGGLFQKSDTATVTLSVAADANANSAVAVDVVAVHDTALLEKLLSLSAAGWFQGSAQLQLDYPGGMTVWSWQVVPGFSPPPRDVSAGSSTAYDVLVFAGYQTPGDHRARIGTLVDVTIQLEQAGFTVVTVR